MDAEIGERVLAKLQCGFGAELLKERDSDNTPGPLSAYLGGLTPPSVGARATDTVGLCVVARAMTLRVPLRHDPCCSPDGLVRATKERRRDMQEKTSVYTIRDPQGQTHSLQGNPQLLTLNDAFEQISGKTGGERWSPNQVQFRVGSKSYSASERRSFSELGIMSGDVIELVGS